MHDVGGRAQQVTLGVGFANAIDGAGTAHGRLLRSIGRGAVVSQTLKRP
jgi:hypothetical protein